MQNSKSICVFCGSAAGSESFQKIARELGAFLASHNWNIVYGGASIGLMGIMADAALKAGGKVTGVIPEFLKKREIAHAGLSALHVTATMHARQIKMAELADAFVILPGGLGTMAEFFEVLTWKQIGLHNKPIILINTEGYWDHLLKWMESAQYEKFLREENLFHVVDEVRQIGKLFSE